MSNEKKLEGEILIKYLMKRFDYTREQALSAIPKRGK